MAKLNDQDEAAIPAERAHVEQPTLVKCSRDPVGHAGFVKAGTRPWVRRLEVRELDAGHWVQLEKGGEVDGILKGYFEGLGGR